jgi:tetratricopeptide (TPR) repeat protein
MNEKLQKYIENKKYDLALQFIHKIQKKDYSLEYHNYKIVVYLLSQKYDAALLELTALLLKYPDDPTFLCNMGLAHKGKKNFVEAANFLNKSLEIDSENLNSYLNLTEVYIESFDYAKAIELLKKILQKNNRLERCYQLLAFCYREINSFEESHKNLEFSIQLNPFNYENYFHLGFSFIWKKEYDKALNSFKECLKYNNKYIPAIYQLNKLSTSKENLDFKSYLLNLRDNDLDIYNLAYKNLTLSEIFYSEKDFNQFFKYLHQANSLKNSLVKYTPHNHNFIKLKYEKIQKYKFDELDPIPIFILGMPRSGSSLIEQVLSQSQDIYAAGELPVLHECFKNIKNEASLDFDELIKVRNRYQNFISLLPKKKFIIDKLPLNFLWIGFIKILFPNAIFIHSIRNKVDICMSLYRTFFADGVLEFSYNQNNITKFYSCYLDMMNFWSSQNINFINIDYDQIIEDPIFHFKKLFNDIGIQFHEAFIDLEKINRPVKTASFLQINNKLKKFDYPDWTQYPKEISIFLES